MHVRVLYFAIVRERLGLEEETVTVPDGADVAALKRALEVRHASLEGRLDAVRFARNERFCALDEPLAAGDVVAIVPPVAGGSGPAPASARVTLRQDALSFDAVIELVRHPGAGALATFVGWVRDHNDGRAVEALEYSAYESMALKEMARVVEELEREIPGVRLAVHHRLGALKIGDEAVICAASAAHRDEAFRAGRALIDRIKDRVPIWKKERGPDGAVWIGSEGEGAIGD